MLNYLKKKLGMSKNKDVPPTEQFYTPLRIALHSTIELDTVDLLGIRESLHPAFTIPFGTCEVLAIGKMNFDGTPVYQVYIKDENNEEFIIQIVEGKNYRSQEPTVDEITLYKQIVMLEPETETSLERALNEIGLSMIEVDGVTYERIWGDQFTEKAEMRTFTEGVITPGGRQEYTNNYILYRRTISDITGSDLTEFLLVGLEEDENSAQIAMMVGLPFSTFNIRVQ